MFFIIAQLIIPHHFPAPSIMTIRPAKIEDMAAVADIYNNYINETTVTFETEAVTTSDREKWFEQFSENGPHRLLVAEENARLIGFSSSVRYHERAAYYTSVMTSVYLRNGESGRGVGKLLYKELLKNLESHPELHRAYALISLPNDASLRLHKKFGFTDVGTLDEAGRKFDRYLSVKILQRNL